MEPHQIAYMFIMKLMPSYIKTAVSSAIQRCTNANCKISWDNYGGRGIKVCQPWLDNPELFAMYLMTLEGWNDPNLVLDRVNNDGNYEPGNLRWATYSESARNRRSPCQFQRKQKEPKQKSYVQQIKLPELTEWVYERLPKNLVAPTPQEPNPLHIAINHLAPRYALVIQLRFYEGYKLHEIGKILSVSKERVRQIEKRALHLLRKELLRG